MESSTQVLRRLLDERGVKWIPVAWNPKRETFYHAANGVGFCADEYTDGVKIYADATITPEQAVEATLGPREQPPYDELIEALRRDWDIEASWDGLRRFWYVGLTDEGVRKRDEREATLGRGTCRITDERYKECMALVHEANERIDELRELVRDMYESMDVSCQFGHAIPAGTMAHVKNRAIGLGIEVDNG